MSKPVDLKPCPFCGGEAERTEIGWAVLVEGAEHGVICPKCGAAIMATVVGGPMGLYKAITHVIGAAVRKWNKRADA